MKRLRVWLRRLMGVLPNERRDHDLIEEIESNLQLHIDENIRAGMKPEEARRRAIIKLGGLEPAKEAYRDSATVPVFENLIRDVRFAIRQLRKNLAFTATAVLMLSLGMCASVAIFAFVDAALLKPLPYREPGRLVGVAESLPGVCPFCNLSYLDFLDWKHSNSVFSEFDAYNHQNFIMTTGSGVERAFGTRVTDGFFHTLGVTPILGRDFRRGEDLISAPRTVILSYSAWQKRYGGKTDVLGRSVILDGQANVIVGVLPPDFHFAPAEPVEYWVTMHASSECDLRRSCHSLFGVARLGDGISFQAAFGNVTSIAKQLEKQYPGSNLGQGAALKPLTEVITGKIRPILLVMLSGACLLLLIAGVNVASLLLVRTEGRKRELAVRSGLGASRGRITSQFVAEGMVLVVAGSALGLVAAYWTMKLLTALISTDMLLGMPYLSGLALTPRVLTFAGLVAILAAILFALTPALRLPALSEGLAEGSRGSAGNTWRRLGSKLVVVELASAVVLLAGAGLLGRSLYQLLTVQIGLQPDHLVLMYVNAPDGHYKNDQQNIAFQRQVTSAISAIPGVTSVGITSDVPIGFNGDTTWFRILGRPWHGEHNDTPERDVTPDYFKTIGATLRRGRYFSEAEDSSKAHVAIVNETFARQYFPGEDPLGKQISPLGPTPSPIEIVGLVTDIKEGPLDEATRAALYFPFNQSTSHDFGLFARINHPEGSVLPAMRTAIHKIDAGIVTSAGQTMSERINSSQAAYLHRSLAWLVGGFAALALMLGVVGLYGVIAYSVGQRTREIGVRMALGAERTTVYRLILKEASGLIAAGIVVGILGSVAAASLIRNLLFEVSSADPATLISVSLLLALSAILASIIPAHRAASINPVDALRAE